MIGSFWTYHIKTMKKKLISVLLIAAMTLTMLAGCGGSK